MDWAHTNLFTANKSDDADDNLNEEDDDDDAKELINKQTWCKNNLNFIGTVVSHTVSRCLSSIRAQKNRVSRKIFRPIKNLYIRLLTGDHCTWLQCPWQISRQLPPGLPAHANLTPPLYSATIIRSCYSTGFAVVVVLMLHAATTMGRKTTLWQKRQFRAISS